MTAKEWSMKGYELYSWQADGTWHYALIVGTNRLKTFDEITAPAATHESLTALRQQLARLACGEEIQWITWTDARLALPPQETVADIVKVCQELGLNLTVAR